MKETTKEKITALIERYPALAVCRDDLTVATQILIDCWTAGGKLLVTAAAPPMRST